MTTKSMKDFYMDEALYWLSEADAARVEGNVEEFCECVAMAEAFQAKAEALSK